MKSNRNLSESMEVVFSPKAEKELEVMDRSIALMFIAHTEKLKKMPPRRHMRFGLPFNVESVTKQARMVYDIDHSGNTLTVMHCFQTHKEYERWYNSFK